MGHRGKIDILGVYIMFKKIALVVAAVASLSATVSHANPEAKAACEALHAELLKNGHADQAAAVEKLIAEAKFEECATVVAPK